MTLDQLTDQTLAHNGRIAALEEKTSSAHKRINENDRITEGIHRLAANVEALALQVKLLTEKLDDNVGKLEESLQRQGERIGALEREPAHRWKSLVAQVTSILVAALIGGVLAKFI